MGMRVGVAVCCVVLLMAVGARAVRHAVHGAQVAEWAPASNRTESTAVADEGVLSRGELERVLDEMAAREYGAVWEGTSARPLGGGGGGGGIDLSKVDVNVKRDKCSRTRNVTKTVWRKAERDDGVLATMQGWMSGVFRGGTGGDEHAGEELVEVWEIECIWDPMFVRVVPAGGPSGGGTEVAVVGLDFENTGTIRVRFAGEHVVAGVFVSERIITCLAPPHPSVGAVRVEVALDGHNFTAAQETFTYYAPTTLTHVTPVCVGAAGGTVVQLAGDFLNADAGGMQALCRFGSEHDGVKVNATVAGDGTVACTVPRVGGAGSVAVAMSLNQQQWASAPTPLYAFQARAAGITPSSGPATGGTVVVIKGSGFAAQCGVVCLFGDTAVAATVKSSSTLHCVVPAGAAGSDVPVRVSMDGRTALADALSFAYYATPAPTHVTPSAVAAGGAQEVTVHGSGFVETGEAACEWRAVGGAGRSRTAKAARVTGEHVVCVAPAALAHGAYAVHVSLNGKDWSAAVATRDTFAKARHFQVYALTPRSGPLSGGTRVTVLSGGFAGEGEATCLLSGHVSPAHYDAGADALVCEVGAGVTATASELEVRIGSALFTSQPLAFRYYEQPLAGVTLVPEMLPQGGDSAVTVTGVGFVDTGEARVRLGDGVAVEARVVSPTELRFTSPAVELGGEGVREVPLALALNGQQFTPLTPARVYVDPVIARVEPESALIAGGTTVTLHGEGFFATDTLGIALGSTYTGAATFVSARQVTFVTPQVTARGAVVPRVTLNGQDYVEAPSLFEFVDENTVTLTEMVPGGAPVTQARVVVYLRGFNVEKLRAPVCRYNGNAKHDTRGRVVDGQKVECVVPPFRSLDGQTQVQIQLVVDDAPTNAATFHYYGISEVATPAGAVSGSKVVVRGAGFTGDKAECAFFASEQDAAAPTVVRARVRSASQLECQSPAVAAPSRLFVEVRVGAGAFTSQRKSVALFKVHAYTPHSGPVTGGTAVTVVGAGFTDTGDAVQCRFGARTVVPGKVVSEHEVTCEAPAVGEPGEGDVAVTLNGREWVSFSGKQAFTWYAVPDVQSVSPALVPMAGGVEVTVGGKHFVNTGTIRVVFARGRTKLAVDAVYQSPLAVTCVAPAWPAGVDGNAGVHVALNGQQFVGTAEGGGVLFQYYSFTALKDAAGGAPRMQLHGADAYASSFMVWMLLSPETFWVNLNPQEPNRMVDRKLGITDPGHILLEADFQLKKSVSSLIHPDSRMGKLFWDTLYNKVGVKEAVLCLTFRQWIVPGKTTVVEKDDTIYFVSTLMDVKQELEYLELGSGEGEDAPKDACPPDADPEMREYGELVFRKLILPELVNRVNTQPEYTALRHIWYQRILAEYYADRHPDGGVYAAELAAGDIRPYRSADKAWTLQALFDRYVKSVSQGEFHVEKKVRVGDLIFVRNYYHGAIDWTELDLDVQQA